jgi:hypothetical protein
MSEAKNKSSDEIANLERPVMCCYTCTYWGGDKGKANRMIAENPVSMDLFKGWPDTGSCKIDYEWFNPEVRGDAFVTMETDANFGCPYWGA